MQIIRPCSKPQPAAVRMAQLVTKHNSCQQRAARNNAMSSSNWVAEVLRNAERILASSFS
jgi:hypothetical protein